MKQRIALTLLALVILFLVGVQVREMMGLHCVTMQPTRTAVVVACSVRGEP